MTDILIPKKNVIMDATLLSSLMSCARFADFRFNLQLHSRLGKSSSLEKGSLVHHILEHFYKAIQSGNNRKDAINTGLTAGRVYLRNEVKNATDDDVKLVYDTMDQYFEHYKNDSWIPIDVEYVKQILLYEDDEMRILWKSKLDLTVDTNNGLYPVDHKTYSRTSDNISLNNQFMGQCLVCKTRGIIIDKIGFQTSLKPAQKFLRPMISYSLDRLTEWSQIIVPYWGRMMLYYAETGYWPPNFTHCESKYSICQFIRVCESDTGMREEELRLNFIKGDKWDVLNED